MLVLQVLYFQLRVFGQVGVEVPQMGCGETIAALLLTCYVCTSSLSFSICCLVMGETVIAAAAAAAARAKKGLQQVVYAAEGGRGRRCCALPGWPPPPPPGEARPRTELCPAS
mmetsp:Transcript_45316/g.89069  ORF Transcript_45316/g.89069 Transcript_45316/m.89069 type:complete len:113 (-) Transcript_45316:126-464(-)